MNATFSVDCQGPIADDHRRKFRTAAVTGVAKVMQLAAQQGYSSSDPSWCNLGQGQPDVGSIVGAPERLRMLTLEPEDYAYGPALGIEPLRQAVAGNYNRLYRSRLAQYSANNVAIAGGGRVMLSRVLASLGHVRLGYQAPDYPGYEELIYSHGGHVTPIHVLTRKNGRIDAERLARAIVEERLDAYLLSNPCNPTGQLLKAGELRACVEVARETGCLLILDEIYSHFIYDGNEAAAGPVSAAHHVVDVDHDPVLIIDGLTKNFRCPGWRVAWAVGPSEVIDCIGCTGSSFDGGAAVPLQRAAVRLLETQRADQEASALREVFARKRRSMLAQLTQIGISVPRPPQGTFYVWGNISRLPPPYNDATRLFRAALEHKVILVPGYYFDVNPGGLRQPNLSYWQWVRFSFGPSEERLRRGMSRLRELICGQTGQLRRYAAFTNH